MSDVLEQIRPALNAALVATALAVLAFMGHALRIGIEYGRTWLEARSSDARWKAATGKLSDAALAGASAAEQTIAKRLREIDPVGTLTASQAADVMSEALAVARLHLGPQTLVEIGKALELTPSRIEDVLRARIEGAVLALKRSRPLEGIVLASDPPPDSEPARATVDLPGTLPTRAQR